MDYEYGIGFYRSDPNGLMEDEQGPHRDGMTLEEAVGWLDWWKNYGGNLDAFYLIRRPKGPWEPVDEVPALPPRRAPRRTKRQNCEVDKG